jgi:AAA ATPase-like protein
VREGRAMEVEIVGRQEQLLALEAFLEAAPAGGQALLLGGDAGIGKTVLWQEALRVASTRDFRVLRSRPTQSEAQVALAAIGDLLAPDLSGVLERLAPVQRRALETALLIRQPDEVFPDTRVLGLALLSTVQALAEERPVLVALDDAQWLDASSGEVLRFMLRRLDVLPVAVLATVRGRPVQVPLELDRSFAGFRRLQIEPLSVGAIHRLLWGRLGIAVPWPVIVRVHEITGGNPFFALELGRALVDHEIRGEDADVVLPESLRAVVAQRLDSLPARVRETLVAVAALAAPSVALLETLGGTLVDDVELAQRRGVVEFDGERIRFTHPLFAPACYEAMPLHRRRRLHQRLAELDVDLEERARHLAIAAAGPDEQVAEALDAAAAHARSRGAAQAAADLAERAVALTPPEGLEIISRRRITAAEHCRDAGDVKKAKVLLEDVVASTPPGRVRADALSKLAGIRGLTEGFPVDVCVVQELDEQRAPVHLGRHVGRIDLAAAARDLFPTWKQRRRSASIMREQREGEPRPLLGRLLDDRRKPIEPGTWRQECHDPGHLRRWGNPRGTAVNPRDVATRGSVPRREDLAAVGRQRDRVLEVGGE